jgi:hypothetical protein
MIIFPEVESAEKSSRSSITPRKVSPEEAVSLALAASSLSTSTLPEVTPAVNAESTSILPRIISPEDVVKLQELNLSSEAVSLLEVPSSTRSPEKDCGISNSILTLLEYKPEKKEDFVFTLMRRVLPVTWASMYGTKEGSFVRTIPVREALTFGESTILRLVSVLDTEISIFLMEPGSNSLMSLTSYTLLIPKKHINYPSHAVGTGKEIYYQYAACDQHR